MRRWPSRIRLLAICVAAVAVLAYFLLSTPPVDDSAAISSSEEAIARGAYLVNAGGCVSCHLAVNEDGSTDSAVLSGGHALVTDFGTFYAPNITPDVETGIGDWRAQDFLLALQHGRSPEGSFYFPAFPYRSYAGLNDQDVLDIGAYLLSLDPVNNAVPEHETPWWLSRFALVGWNLLADLTGGKEPELISEQEDSLLIERGAYLARNLGHCGECHTPRNALGISQLAREFSGAQIGEDKIEAIDRAALEDWDRSSFDLFLLLGMKPDSDFVGGDMSDVIEHNTSRLTDADRLALAAFFTR
ncbi:MAG: cytochrome c [Gammaproteobacteria bacterium]|jgi:mono/diheme cytochrome c family protein|nr:cytochrome c [Pseudomonadales bacterium]MDP4781755.1 cytochrome c [Gammaproteobacteria bacterium]